VSAERPPPSSAVGAWAEAQVAEQLVGLGGVVLARNWRGGGGELDLVARVGGELWFVEVKARHGEAAVEELVTASKRRRLVRAAEAWLNTFGEPRLGCCFVVAVLDLQDPSSGVAWWIDAFDQQG
jgi:putative endonuclease